MHEKRTFHRKLNLQWKKANNQPFLALLLTLIPTTHRIFLELKVFLWFPLQSEAATAFTPPQDHLGRHAPNCGSRNDLCLVIPLHCRGGHGKGLSWMTVALNAVWEGLPQVLLVGILSVPPAMFCQVSWVPLTFSVVILSLISCSISGLTGAQGQDSQRRLAPWASFMAAFLLHQVTLAPTISSL